MDNSAKKETMLFVALPGSDPYAEVPKRQVKEQLDKGLLKQSALIWSQKHNSWKQARHITQLIANKLPPRAAQAPLTQQPRAPHVSQPATAGQPKIHQAPSVKAPSVPKKAAQPTKVTGTASPEAEVFTLEQSHGAPLWLKAICAALVVIILALLCLNWWYVDKAIKDNLVEDNTAFKNVPVYAHMGGFFQVTNLVIHFRPTSEVTKENVLAYLAAVAAATPDRPFSTNSFNTVSLALGWGANYHIAGRHWRRLGKPDLTDEDRRAILEENLFIAGGDKLLPRTNLDAIGQAKMQEKRWNDFLASFVRKP